jgi:hypothetical protein
MPLAEPHTFKALEQLDKSGNLYILDQGLDYFNKMPYAFVDQNFEKDLYEGLQLIVKDLSEYDCLVMQIDNPKGFSGSKMVESMTKGFSKFCEEYKIPNEVKAKLDKPQKNQCYFIHNDDALIDFIQQCRMANLEIGTDIAIISYNESNLKSVVDKGISTLSTQFNEMGRQLSKMILNNKKEFVKIPFQFTERNSFPLKHTKQ